MAGFEEVFKKSQEATQGVEGFSKAMEGLSNVTTNAAATTVKFEGSLALLKRVMPINEVFQFRSKLLELYQTTLLSGKQIVELAKDMEKLAQASKYQSVTAITRLVTILNQANSAISGVDKTTQDFAVTLGKTFPEGAERAAMVLARASREIYGFGQIVKSGIISPAMAAELAFRGDEQALEAYLQVLEKTYVQTEKMTGIAGSWKELRAALENVAATFGDALAPSIQLVFEGLAKALNFATQFASVFGKLGPLIATYLSVRFLAPFGKSMFGGMINRVTGVGNSVAGLGSVSSMNVTTMHVANMLSGSGRLAGTTSGDNEIALESTKSPWRRRFGMAGAGLAIAGGLIEQQAGSHTTMGQFGGALGTVGGFTAAGAMFGPWGALAGAIVGITKAAYDWKTAIDDAAESTKRLTEKFLEIVPEIEATLAASEAMSRSIRRGGGTEERSAIVQDLIRNRIDLLGKRGGSPAERVAEIREILALELQLNQVRAQQNSLLEQQTSIHQANINRLDMQGALGSAYLADLSAILTNLKNQATILQNQVTDQEKIAGSLKDQLKQVRFSIEAQHDKVLKLVEYTAIPGLEPEAKAKKIQELKDEEAALQRLLMTASSIESSLLKLTENRRLLAEKQVQIRGQELNAVNKIAQADLSYRDQQIRGLEAHKNIIRDLYLPTNAIIGLTIQQVEHVDQQLAIEMQRLAVLKQMAKESGNMAEWTGLIATKEADILDIQAKKASLLAQTRRTWMEQMTAMSIGMPTGTFALPTNLGTMAQRGPGWFPFANTERMEGIGTYSGMIQKMMLGQRMGMPNVPGLRGDRSPINAQIEILKAQGDKLDRTNKLLEKIGTNTDPSVNPTGGK